MQTKSIKNSNAANNGKQTFEELKKTRPDTIFLFRVGDAYEIRNEDAKKASKVLPLPLQEKDGKQFISFPYEQIDNYLPLIVRSGNKVAIVEDELNNAPKQAAAPAPKKEEKQQETLLQIKQETAVERAARMQQELQQTLQKLNALQELNKKRTKFIETLDLLKDAKEKMQGEEEFEAKTFRLDFNKEVSYKSDKLFSISNKSVLLDFVDFLQERIKERVELLEAQIIEV